MKKGLRGVLIAVAAVFGLLMVFNGAEIAAKLTGAPNASESILIAGAPGSAAATPAADEASGKSPEVLIQLNQLFMSKGRRSDIGGIFFQDGTYSAVNDDGGSYKQITVDKAGSCFLFFMTPDWNSTNLFYYARSETILLKPGMVAFLGKPVINVDVIYSSYREHSMAGVPIIFPEVGVTVNDYGQRVLHGGTITVRTETSDINFAFTGKAGQDKIPKIPVSGAKDLWYTSPDGKKKTLTDAFNNPLLVKAEVPYSLVEYGENNKWRITPPVRQQKEVKLTQSQIDELLSLEP